MTDATAAPTRRECLQYGTVVGGGLLGGCAGSERDATSTATTGDGDGGYTVSMEPVGQVTFDTVPERWLAYTGDYADMGVALGHGDDLAAIGVRERFGTHYYDELPGVDVDADALTQLWTDGTGKEIFYEVDADVHVVDPNFAIHRLGWDEADVTEVAENVAPFLGNTSFTRTYDWHDYRYYSLFEAFEVMADLFRERERYEAFVDLHETVRARVRSRRPATEPELAVVYPAGTPPDAFWPYLVGDGTAARQWRELGVTDALAANGITDAQAGGTTIDYETLLEVDPDAIAVRLQGADAEAYVRENVLDHLRDHDVAGQLSAVQDGRVFYGGLTYQGPILYLFQLEAAAQGLYPDAFGDERLFDRDRVADIVAGAV